MVLLLQFMWSMQCLFMNGRHPIAVVPKLRVAVPEVLRQTHRGAFGCPQRFVFFSQALPFWIMQNLTQSKMVAPRRELGRRGHQGQRDHSMFGNHFNYTVTVIFQG